MHIPRRVHFVGAHPILLRRAAGGRLVVPIELADLTASDSVALEAAVAGTATFTIVPAPLTDLGITPTARVSFRLRDGAVREYDSGEGRLRLGTGAVTRPWCSPSPTRPCCSGNWS
jgi:hypothetical protein